MDYLKKLEELTDAIHKVEDIIKEMNEEKLAVVQVNMGVPFNSIASPELRTQTESDIVCFSVLPDNRAFDIRELMETKFSENSGYVYADFNGVEVCQWTGEE